MAETQNAPATIEVNDFIFCTHFNEVCTDCGFDGREENDSFFGLDPRDREGIVCPPATLNKDGVYTCGKHGSAGCSQCFGWKKQLNKVHLQAKKAGRK